MRNIYIMEKSDGKVHVIEPGGTGSFEKTIDEVVKKYGVTMENVEMVSRDGNRIAIIAINDECV